MPPPRLETTLNSSLHLCRSCQVPSPSVRSFTTTSIKSNIRPESPRYVEVPKSVQEEHIPKPPLKGTIPVPREIFPRRRPDKPSRFYLEDATPEPKNAVDVSWPDKSHAERATWKKRMAAKRRTNLREGLVELYRRKQRTDRTIAERSNYKSTEREHLINQAEREDERLTNSTILQAMQPVSGAQLPDPEREQRLAAKKERAEAMHAQKQEQRKDALQTLYLQARSFITTEEQLQAEIDRVFPSGENPAWKDGSYPGKNIWNLGLPPTIGDRLNDSQTGDRTFAQNANNKHPEVAQKRIGRIADALGFKQ